MFVKPLYTFFSLSNAVAEPLQGTARDPIPLQHQHPPAAHSKPQSPGKGLSPSPPQLSHTGRQVGAISANSKLPQETQLPTLQAHCSQLAPAPQPRQAPNFPPNPSIRLKKPSFTPVQLLGSGARPKLLLAVQLMPVASLSRAQRVWE